DTKRSISQPRRLPRTVVDEWGFVHESQQHQAGRQGPLSKQSHRRYYLALEKYRKYLEAWSDFSQNLDAFLQQAPPVLQANVYLGRAQDDIHRRRIEGILAENSFNTELIRLSVFNFAETVKSL